jgi:hypothetical protein
MMTISANRARFLPLCLAWALVAPALSGCAVLLGNVKTVDQHSNSYRVARLNETQPDWKMLEPSGDATSDSSEITYQSNRTASIISLNSTCRKRNTDEDLKRISRLLFLGITDVTETQERDLTVDSSPALETTVTGRLNREKVKIRAVVLRNGACVFDLMYVAKPRHFASQEADFTQFVSSLRLR